MKWRLNVCLVVFLMGIMIFSVCSAKQPSLNDVSPFADPMTENVLIAMNEDSYRNFSRDFSDGMKIGLSEEKYKEKIPLIKKRIGEYIANSKECLGYEVKNEKVTIRYKAKFTREPEQVIVNVIFTEQGDKKCISGFWLDYPKLPTNKYDNIIKKMNSIIVQNENDSVAYQRRGNAYLNKGQYDLAISDFNKAIELNANYAAAYLDRGIANLKIKQCDLAIKDFDAAINIDPSYAKPYLNKGQVYEDQQLYQSAIDTYRSFLANASSQDIQSIETAKVRIRALGGVV
ncbi:MAG: Tetratricopeptide repeat-containing protein [Firmicutes bacterium]|nr:Tetratricopeptide repeat-containing protein [Bacillota bacterium]